MDVLLGVLVHCIMFSNSWDISGAMGDVWNKDLIFTKAPLTGRRVGLYRL